MIQLLGSGFGHEASTVKVGTSPADAGRGSKLNDIAAMQRESVPAKRATARARSGVGVIRDLPRFLTAAFAAWRAVNRGEND
jgi:hypothetical protein